MEKKTLKAPLEFEVVGVKPGIIISSKYGEVDLSKLEKMTEDHKKKLAEDDQFPYLVKK